MRRSGAPSQRSFSGLLNLPSPKTPVQNMNLGEGSPGVSNSKTNIHSATQGLSSNAGEGMMTSEVKDSKSSLKAPGLESDLLPSKSAQMYSPSTQPVHLRKPESPTLPNRSPLLQLNCPAAVLRQSSPAGPRLLGQNPNQATTSIPTTWSPAMRSSTCKISQSPSEAKKLFPSNLTPAAAVDTATTNSTSFRCFHNRTSSYSDTLC